MPPPPPAPSRFERPLRFLRRRFSPRGVFGLHLTIGLLVIILGFWIFAEIAEDLQPESPLVTRDQQVAAWFHAHSTPGLAAAARVVTTFGSARFLAPASIVIAILLVRRKAWNRLLIFASGMIGGSLLNIVLKHFFHRQRPVLENPLVTLSSYGFPSGHTMGATIFCGLLVLLAFSWWRQWPRRVLAVVLAGSIVLVVGLTRIYLGAHYLTDVLAAIAAGAVWLALCWSAGESLRKHRRERAHDVKFKP